MRGLYFRTRSGNLYFYDGVTGLIDAVDKTLEECMNLYSAGFSKEAIEDKVLTSGDGSKRTVGGLKHFYELIDASSFEEENIFPVTSSARIVKNALSDYGDMTQLIINVTEDCNFRCRYCYLSEVYEYSRNRSERCMNFDIAKKAMDDFFCELNQIIKYNPCKEVAISFYGGEPLMNFDLIKECAEYAHENCPTNVVFAISTNGSLLDDDKVDFLVENNFYIGISLDGDKINHNRNRVFQNKKGTYDIVLERINRFLTRHGEYKNCSLLLTLDPKADLLEIDNFFETNNLPRVGFVSMVLDKDTKYYEQFTEDDYNRFQEQYIALRDKYIDYKINDWEMSTFLRAFFELPMVSVIYRNRFHNEKNKIIPYTGTCMPGSKRSIRADGTIDICERVNECFEIGDISTGLNYSKIAGIINKYNNIVTTNCANCPINNNCSICFAQTMSGDMFCKPNCDMIINSFLENLYIYYSVLEKNPFAYDYFKVPLDVILNG